MKICIVSDFLPHYHKIWSGAELMTISLYHMLKEKNLDVFFITTAFDFDVSKSEKRIFQLRKRSNRIGVFLRNFLIDIPAIISMYRIIKSEKPEIIHINAKYLYLSSILCGYILKIPSIVSVPDYFMFCPTTFIRRPTGENCFTYHGYNCYKCLEVLTSIELNARIKKVTKILIQLILCLRMLAFDFFNNLVTQYIVLSNASKKRLLNYGIPERKISIAYHYRLTNPSPTSEEIANNAIVFVGWLSKENGVDILVESFRYVISKHSNSVLYLVGSGDEKFINSLKRKIDTHNFYENVKFLGKKENQEVLSILKLASIVVVPHQWEKEFGPVILLEAQIMGRPVITSAIGATDEYIRDGISGFLIKDYKNPLAFAEKIIYLLDNQLEMIKIGREGAIFATDFLSGDKIGERLVTIYRSAIIQKEAK